MYMEQAIRGDADTVERRIAGTLTKEQVEAWEASQKSLYGKESDGGAVKRELPRLKATMEQETYRRLLPGYVGRFLENAAPLVDIGIEGDIQGIFALRPLKPGRLDWLLPYLERYAPQAREACTLYHPSSDDEETIFLHPGEPVFDRFRDSIRDRFAQDALRGAIFIDPTAQQSYYFHLAQVAVERIADATLHAFERAETLESRLIGLKQWQDGTIEECSLEHLLLLRGSGYLPPSLVSFAANADDAAVFAVTFAREQVVEKMAQKKREKLLADMHARKEFVERSFIYQAADLAELRKKQKEKAEQGDIRAKGELTRVKQRQQELAQRKEEALAVIEREPVLVMPGKITFLAHALVVPSSDPEERMRYDADVEATAVRVARAHEEALGATVIDVSTAERALAAGLGEWPGFDLWSLRPGGERVAIEVKGRVGFGTVELTENEYIQACQLQDGYWLYTVFECAKPQPRLCRVQNPFKKLIVNEKKRFVINEGAIFAAAEEDKIYSMDTTDKQDTQGKRLIEVDFPLKQTSLDSVHEKNVRHGHISTLHIWPARRPLAASRAALIATLLPDPGNDEERKIMMEKLAGRIVEHVKKKKLPNGGVEEQVTVETEGGILHWGRESGADLQWFRDKIREAYGGRAPRVLDPFAGGGAIPLEAMRLGCEVTAVDINPVAWFILKCTLEYPQRLANQLRPLPDFACQSREFMESYFKAKGFKGAALEVQLSTLGLKKEQTSQPQLTGIQTNVVSVEADLAWHVRAWGWWVLQRAKADLERFYPTVDGKPTVAYLWARTVSCKNCRATVPLLKTRWLCKKDNKRVVLTMEPNADRTGVVFGVQNDAPALAKGSSAQKREYDKQLAGGTMSRSGVTCPCCSTIMTMEDIRREAQLVDLGAVMTAVVVDGDFGKEYRIPTDEEIFMAAEAEKELSKVYAEDSFWIA